MNKNSDSYSDTKILLEYVKYFKLDEKWKLCVHHT